MKILLLYICAFVILGELRVNNNIKIYKKTRFIVVFSSFFLLDNVVAAPFLESAKVAPENISSCIADSGINPLSNQVELTKVDIVGPLPLIRTYSTAVYLGETYQQYNVSLIDSEIRELGIGWTHNYAYKMEEGTVFGLTGVSLALRVFLPEVGKYMYFLKGGDGIYYRSSGAPHWGIYKDKETTITVNSSNQFIVNHKGTEVIFEVRSGMGFYPVKVTYPGGKILTLTNVYSSEYKRWLLTKVDDNRGNSLYFERINLDGRSTDPNAQYYRGSISSITTNNQVLPQKVNYSYNVGQVTWPSFFYYGGGDKAYTLREHPNLVEVIATSNPKENYNYVTYSKPAAFNSSVSFPVISELKQADILRRTWAYKDNGISSRIPNGNGELKQQSSSRSTWGGTSTSIINTFANDTSEDANIEINSINNQSVLSIFRRFNNKLIKIDKYIRELNLTNSDVGGVPLSVYQGDERYARYQADDYASCLTYNNIPIKNIITSNSIRQLTSISDQNSNRTDFSYDENNRLIETIEAKGTPIERKTTLFYDTKFWIPSTIKRGNLTQNNKINTFGQIVESTQSSTQVGSINKTTVYEYLVNGLLSLIDGPKKGTSDKVSYTYDAYGNKATESQFVNGAERITSYIGYNSYGQPERIIYPSGLINKFNYNLDGTLKSKSIGESSTSIEGKTTEYTYDILKRITSEINPDGEITSYSYNLKDQPTSVTAPDGSKIIKEYYGNGVVSVEKKTDSTGSTIFDQILTEIDINGRPKVIKYGFPAWSSITISYDGNGNKIESNSALNIAEKWTYNAFNEILSHSNGLGNVDIKTYDAQNNTISALDSLKSGTNPYSYRNGSVLTQEVNADYGIKNYIYDEADQLIQSTFGIRKCENLRIDEIDRVGEKICTDLNNSTPFTLQHGFNYEYDKTKYGNLDFVTSKDSGYGSTTAYIYDQYGRIVGKTQTNTAISTWGGTQANLSVGYAYTLGDKLLSLRLPSGRIVTFTYDAINKSQLRNINLDKNALIREISYNGLGQIAGWNWGNGSARYEQTYDAKNHGVMKSITNKDSNGSINYSLVYDFDQDNRIIKISRDSNVNDTFSYDNADHLTKETRSNGTTNIFDINYTYDSNGNRLNLTATGSHQQPQSSVTYTYIGNKLNTIAGSVVKYTDNAEMIYGDFTPIYDYSGNRREDKTTGGGTASPQYYMAYNHKNERTILGYTANGSVSKTNAIQYVYDETSHLIGEYNADGVPLVEYVWMGDKPVAAIYGSGITTKTYWIVNDAQNTPRRLIDAADGATTVWAWDSTAFGVGIPRIQAVKFNLRFPGQYYDELTKQHYNHNRFYNPVLGRYMEPDRIGLEGGLNPYIYASANPVSNIDITGLQYLAAGWSSVSNPSVFSQDQTWRGVQNQFLYGSGIYYADLQKFGFDQFIDIDQQIQKSISNPNGFMRNIINQTEVGKTSSYSWQGKAFGSNYISSFLTSKAWPFGRIAADVSGTINKYSNGSYLATGIVTFRPDTYSWKPDYGRFVEDTGIKTFGLILGNTPSVNYRNNIYNGEMPVSYPRTYWFVTPGKWK